MNTVKLPFSSIVFLLVCLVFNHAQANDDFLGHWRIVSTGYAFNPLTKSNYDISIEKTDNGYSAWAYNGPLGVTIDGKNIEIVIDWVEGADLTHESKLIGTLNDDGEITGILDHEKTLDFNGRELPNGEFTGVRIPNSRANATVEDLPPDPVDLTGFWGGAFGKGGFNKHHYALTEKGKQIKENFKDMDAPHIRCAGYGLITSSRFAAFLYGIEIFQSDEQVTLVYGSDYVRRVYLDGREYPKKREMTDMGFSTGEWKGNTLVVKTTHLTPNFLRAGHGHPVSGNTYTIEHYYLDDEGYLHSDMWVHDPENYERPPYFQRTLDKNFSARVSTKVGCDAYSFYRQMYMEGELDEFFSRGKYRR